MECFSERIFEGRINIKMSTVESFWKRKNMEKKSTESVIPQGELRCVWMDAGVTGFKLCDQEFHCEPCKFNNIVQNRQTGFINPRNDEEMVVPMEEKAMTADAFFRNTLRNHLEGLHAVVEPQDRMYNRSHYWVQENETGKYRIGINHILANFFQPILSIVVSKAPLSIRRNDPFCWIVLPGGAITLRSPIDATICKFNPALQQKPNLLGISPFGEGWIMELTTKAKGLHGFSSAIDSRQNTERTMRNIEHSFTHAFRHNYPSTGTTLFDGGIGVNSIESILGPKVYLEVVNRIVHLPQ
jgi:glycine cleavage system H lipoate-binding protein